jgi:hypothetical protein
MVSTMMMNLPSNAKIQIHLLFLSLIVAVSVFQTQVQGQLIQLKVAKLLDVKVVDSEAGLVSINQNSNPTKVTASPTTMAPVVAPAFRQTPAPTGNDNEQCIFDFTYPNMSEPTFDICFHVTLFGLGNGQWRASNGKVSINPVNFTNDYSIIDHETGKIIYVIHIQRTEDVIQYLGIKDGPQCQSYSYCGNDLYSADCTNLRYGRNVDCEPAYEIFFPFTSGAASNLVVAKPTTPPTHPPTKSPTKRPSKRPIYNPTRAPQQTLKPTKLPTKVPVRLPTKAPIKPPMTAVSKSPTSAPTGNDNEQCVDFIYPNGDFVEICFKVTLFGLGNGMWRFMNNTVITNPINFDNDYSIIDHETWDIIYVIKIKRTGNVTNFIGLLNGPQCQSHSYCGSDLYSADCTNLQYGRNVTCEPAWEIFFPFTGDAALNRVIANPTRAPV